MTVTTLAGQAGGAVDGPGDVALFASPRDVATDAAGNVYVADPLNDTIRKITPAGMVTTFAGLAYAPGTVNGRGHQARFTAPQSVAADSSGNLYVIDSTTIRKITPGGVVTTLAGKANVQGSVDGTGADARFFQLEGIAVDHHGNLFVSDAHTIRKITAAGVVTTIAGVAQMPGSANGNGSAARFYFARAVDVDSEGNVYVADFGNHTIRKVTPGGDVSTFAGSPGMPGDDDGSLQDARFRYPAGLAFDDSGNLYVSAGHEIRKITGGNVSTLAGDFYGAGGLEADGDGNLYVVLSKMILKIAPGGTVSTFAGRSGGEGSADGVGSAARFEWPADAAVDSDGNVFIVDAKSQNVRKITPAGVVSTLVGSVFNYPQGVAVDDDQFVYVADTENHRICKISSSGVVTTLAGMAASPGSTDATGDAARFNMPAGLAFRDGVLYVADAGNHTIRKVSADGQVTTLAGLALSSGSSDGSGSAARFKTPIGVAVDGSGNVYVGDNGNNTIRKITPAGVVTTLAGLAGPSSGSSDGTGSAARFYYLQGIAIDAASNLYVADGDNTIRKVTPAGVVTTVAGLTHASGSADGTGPAARFGYASGVAVGNDGRVYITDMDNSTVRVGSPALSDVATIDMNEGPSFAPRQLDTAPQTATNWTWSVIRRPSGSANDFSSTSIRNPTFVPDVSGLFTFQLHATAGSGASITTVNLNVPSPAPVDLGAPTGFSATAVSATQVTLSWTPVSGATHYEIFRSNSAGGTFVLHNSCPDAACSDFLVSPNTTYLYKVRAMDDGGPSSFSVADPATTAAFTDHSLNGVVAKAAHVLELRTAVNAMRAAAGLGPATFATSVAPGLLIRASAIDELRAAVAPARTALGLSAMTYVDPTLTPLVTRLKAAHIAQLREAVQ